MDLHHHHHPRPHTLSFDLGKYGAGPFEEFVGESHFVLVVLVSPLADRRVRPFLEPLVLHHGQYGHAALPGTQRTHTYDSSHVSCVGICYYINVSRIGYAS